jgi:hypothetical protein
MVGVALVGSVLAFSMLALMDGQYREKRYLSPPMATSLREAATVRAALATYAARNFDYGHGFPAESLSDPQTFRVLINANGAALNETNPAITLRRYTPMDQDADGVYEDYTMSLQPLSVADYNLILVSPSGIEKCLTANPPKPPKPWTLADVLRQKRALQAGRTVCED